MAGIDDPQIAEPAGLQGSVTEWDTEPLVATLYQTYDVAVSDAGDDAAVLARLMATDFHIRHATVTAPMIRLVAPLVFVAPESDPANRCYRSAEYLDRDWVAVDPGLETELENLMQLKLPDSLAEILAHPLRSARRSCSLHMVTQPAHAKGMGPAEDAGRAAVAVSFRAKGANECGGHAEFYAYDNQPSRQATASTGRVSMVLQPPLCARKSSGASDQWRFGRADLVMRIPLHPYPGHLLTPGSADERSGGSEYSRVHESASGRASCSLFLRCVPSMR